MYHPSSASVKSACRWRMFLGTVYSLNDAYFDANNDGAMNTPRIWCQNPPNLICPTFQLSGSSLRPFNTTHTPNPQRPTQPVFGGASRLRPCCPAGYLACPCWAFGLVLLWSFTQRAPRNQAQEPRGSPALLPGFLSREELVRPRCLSPAGAFLTWCLHAVRSWCLVGYANGWVLAAGRRSPPRARSY